MTTVTPDERSLRDLVRKIMQEEVKKLTATPNDCAITSVTEVLRPEIRQALSLLEPNTDTVRPTNAEILRRQPSNVPPPQQYHKQQRKPMCVIDDVTMPPLSCRLVAATCNMQPTGEGVAEQVSTFLLSRGISIVRSLVGVGVVSEQAEVLLTNFSNEYRHITEGTTFAYFEEIVKFREYFAVQQAETPAASAPPPPVHVSTDLSLAQRQSLLDVLASSKIVFHRLRG